MNQPLPAASLAEAYEVLEVVRRGGLSTTLRVRHRGTGDLRCIDVGRPAPGEREVLERRLDTEARPLMELRHPHVVRVVDAAVGQAGEACIVREDHDGVTMRRLTGSHRPSVALAVELLRQAADAVAFLHENGRKVGGLTPEGLLVGHGEAAGAPRLVLGDLGLAKDWQEEAALTAAGLFVGRLKYTAPEQFEASGRQTPPSDIYTLGLVAYELLTGTHPIAGDTASSLIAGHLFRPPTGFAESDPEHRIPEPLRELVLAALSKDPAQRPAAVALRDELARIQGDLPAFEPTEIDRWVGVRPVGSATAVAPGPQNGAAAATVSETTATHPMATSDTDEALRTAATPSRPQVPDAEQLDAWLAEARALARDEEFLDARDKVRKVLKVRPDHSMGLMLLASLEACLKIQVEESKAHQTLVVKPGASEPKPADEQTPRVSVKPLEGGSQTLVLPTAGSAGVGSGPSGTETVQVSNETFQDLVAEAKTANVADAPAMLEPTPVRVDDEMPTQRLETLASPRLDVDAGSQVPGAPASTERLDLLDGLDDGRTRPLKPELLRRVSEAEPPPSATPASGPASGSVAPASASDPESTPAPARVLDPAEFANGTTQLLGATDSPAAAPVDAPGGAPSELPGTVTMPMEQIEEKKRQALERVEARDRDLQARIQQDPGHETWPALESSHSADAAASAETAKTAEVESEPPVLPTLPSIPTQAPTATPREVEAGHPSSFADPAPTSPPIPPTEPVPVVRQEARSPTPTPTPAPSVPASETGSVDELGFGGAPAPAFVERTPRGRARRRGKGGRRTGRPGDSGRRGSGRGVMFGAVLAALLVFAIGYAVAAGIDLRRLVGLGETEQTSPPIVDPPVAVEPGLLLLDAAPWAVIVRITDPIGEEVPLRFRHTPALFELAPGTYKVVLAPSEDGGGLSNGSDPEGSDPEGSDPEGNETFEVEVLSQQTTSVRPEFAQLSVDDYFRLMEWQ